MDSKVRNLVIVDFFSNFSIEDLSQKHSIDENLILKEWEGQYGIELVKKRQDNVENEQGHKCPICGKIGNKEYISRHIANRGHTINAYKEFINGQLEWANQYYNRNEYIPPKLLILEHDLYLSPSFLNKNLNKRSDFQQLRNKHQSKIVSQQYKDKKRTKNIKFPDFQLTREDYPSRFLDKERYNIIVKFFKSDLFISDIQKQTQCKHETIMKIWKENFTSEQIIERKYRTRWKYKPTKEQEAEIIKLFDSELTNKDIAERFNTANSHIKRIFIEEFGEEAYKEKIKENKKKGILKSLRSCGKSGIRGSFPEVTCYKLLVKGLPRHKIVHHDFEICEPYEIDISIPELKVAISWDGIFHREPIFGQKELNMVKKRDKKKEKILLEKKWKLIIVEDDIRSIKKHHVESIIDELIEKVHLPGSKHIVKLTS